MRDGLCQKEESNIFEAASKLCSDKEQLLRVFLEHKASGSNRYTDEEKRIGELLALLTGPKAYEILSNNLPLPSFSSVKNYIYNSNDHLVEGQIRVKEFRKFLEERSYPFYVCISQDATACEPKAEFDSVNNVVVGLAASLNEHGMPDVDLLEASSAKNVFQAFETMDKCRYIFVIMAQPLCETATPFLVDMFSSNNKFSAADVKKRILFVVKQLF